MSRFLSTLAATPDPSLTRPRRMCSVPMYSWLNRWASWLASCITLRARSVKRSYIEAFSDRPAPAAALKTSGRRVERCPWDALPGRFAGRGQAAAGAVTCGPAGERLPLIIRTARPAFQPAPRERAGPARSDRPRKLDAAGRGTVRHAGRGGVRVQNQSIIVGR